MAASKNGKQPKSKKDVMRVSTMVEVRGAGKKKITPYQPNRLRDGS